MQGWCGRSAEEGEEEELLQGGGYNREEVTTGRRVEEPLQIFTDECAVTQFPGSSHPSFFKHCALVNYGFKNSFMLS